MTARKIYLCLTEAICNKGLCRAIDYLSELFNIKCENKER